MILDHGSGAEESGEDCENEDKEDGNKYVV